MTIDDKLISRVFNVVHYGEEVCESSHGYGPAFRDYYLIHYILSGKGRFEKGDQVFELANRQGFLIRPDEITYYEADRLDPWHYVWIGFNGSMSEKFLDLGGFNKEAPVFTYNGHELDMWARRMRAADQMSMGKEFQLQALLYEFFATLIEATGKSGDDGRETRTSHYVDQCCDYIEKNHIHQITVSDIAREVGLDRSYLNSLFKKAMNKSLQDYLVDYRLDRACRLLKKTQHPIGTIARSVGYRDPLLFSKMFHRRIGISPSQYRI